MYELDTAALRLKETGLVVVMPNQVEALPLFMGGYRLATLCLVFLDLQKKKFWWLKDSVDEQFRLKTELFCVALEPETFSERIEAGKYLHFEGIYFKHGVDHETASNSRR